MKRHTLVAAMLLSLALHGAHAGRSCESRPPSAVNVQRAMTLAETTASRLDASGAQVVVLARAGQDLGKYGLRWSHLGWAYRDTSADRPAWRVVHKLNQCGTATAALYRQGLGEFFLDDLHEYAAAVAIPSADVQARMLPLLKDNQRIAQMHTPAYNMVAYPWAQTYQQSNQWAIETLALAMDGVAGTRSAAQTWLRVKGYEPTTLRIDALTRLGARVSAANVAFDDHPSSKRFSDRIETVTVDSVFAWLERSRLAAPMMVVQ